MSSSYPRIDPPARQSDGTYVVRVYRQPGHVEEVPAKGLKEARELVRFLERAAVMLIPRDEPVHEPRPVGRPLLLTPRVHKIIVEGYGVMMSLSCIAARAAVSKAVLLRWMAEGDRVEQMMENDPGYEPEGSDLAYFKLLTDARKAQADLQHKLCTDVIDSGKREWIAAMTFLGRRWADDFERRPLRFEGPSEPMTVIFRRPEMAEVVSDNIDPPTAEGAGNGNGK